MSEGLSSYEAYALTCALNRASSDTADLISNLNSHSSDMTALGLKLNGTVNELKQLRNVVTSLCKIQLMQYELALYQQNQLENAPLRPGRIHQILKEKVQIDQYLGEDLSDLIKVM